jgi:transitional endoplasmic reticulum ATPase
MSESETFAYLGCTVELVDAEGVIDAARVRRVELLRGAVFPEPVRRVRLTVAGGIRDGRPVHLLEAEIVLSENGPSAAEVRSLVLGNDPLGLLLTRRIEAGDVWTARIVDGVGGAAAAAYRRIGREKAAWTAAEDRAATGPAVLHDDVAGLRATVTHADRTIELRAAVDSDEMGPAQLRAMVELVLRVVAEQSVDKTEGGPGTEPLAGRRYLVELAPTGQPAPPPRTTRTVTLDQVGGLVDVVAELRQIAVSFRHPEAMARWGARRPQGILMYGPPGTGKTMLAQALANEIGATFREIRTPEILDKWLGGSERNIKRIFRDARRYREPTVMLFDEFDSIISYAGAGGDAASQAINAVAGIFKQEMNSLIEENPQVIVVATTNFPHRVDESLIRSGRFDIKISVPRPDQESRAEILRKMISQLAGDHDAPGFRMFAGDLDLAELAGLSTGMTGADIKEVLRRVQLAKAMQEARTGPPVPPITQDELRRSIAELASHS